MSLCHYHYQNAKYALPAHPNAISKNLLVYYVFFFQPQYIFGQNRVCIAARYKDANWPNTARFYIFTTSIFSIHV